MSVISKLPSLLVRVTAGTAVFVLVLAAVQSRDARISGMMLTFPALNGISLMMAINADARAMAHSMLGVIALNGIVSLAFIEAYNFLSIALGTMASTWVWLLSGAAFAVWLLACWVLTRGSRSAERWLFVGFVLVAPLLAGLWWRSCPVQLAGSAADNAFAGLLTTHAPRIGLFAFTLAVLLMASEWLGASNALLGRLGAFPLLPLFSLATIVESQGPASGVERLAIVKPTLLLGLLLAMMFAWLFSGYLVWLRGRARGASWWLSAATGLLTGWLVCGAVIVGGMALVSGLEHCG